MAHALLSYVHCTGQGQAGRAERLGGSVIHPSGLWVTRTRQMAAGRELGKDESEL